MESGKERQMGGMSSVQARGTAQDRAGWIVRVDKPYSAPTSVLEYSDFIGVNTERTI